MSFSLSTATKKDKDCKVMGYIPFISIMYKNNCIYIKVGMTHEQIFENDT